MANEMAPLRKIFETTERSRASPLRQWQEFFEAVYMPLDLTQVEEGPVSVRQYVGTIDNMAVGHTEIAAIRMIATPATLRKTRTMDDTLVFNILTAGEVLLTQEQRTIRQRVGFASICDTGRPFDIFRQGAVEYTSFHFPRERLERLIGNSRAGTALLLDPKLPAVRLVTTFLTDLLNTYSRLSSETAARMYSIGLDLIAAGLAEIMGQDPPKSLQGTIALQKAKAFIMRQLHDPSLNPTLVASATGVSLRYLQTLFKAHNWQVSQWIWQQRLDLAADRLNDPHSFASTLGEVAYQCGFASQAHFSRQFKERFGTTPSEYRHERMLERLAATQAH